MREALAPLFRLPGDKVHVVETTGGLRDEAGDPALAGHAALLSAKAGGRPVKMSYDWAEDVVATPMRAPSRTRHRTAVTPDGRLVAMDIVFELDGGAYAAGSEVVLARAARHAAGPYACPNVRIRARVMATNHAPCGAFGGGAPQSGFAVERQMDRVAAALGLSPEALRRKNVGPSDLGALLDRALALAQWDEKRAAFAAANAEVGARIKRGIGLATAGSGGAVYVATVAVDLLTYQAKVEDVVVVHDLGPAGQSGAAAGAAGVAAGVVECGVTQAIGWALYEQVVWTDGRMVNGQMANYLVPTAVDLPPILVVGAEGPSAEGPTGTAGPDARAQGPVDGSAPAIANALAFALGVPIDRIPALPEDLMAALDAGADTKESARG